MTLQAVDGRPTISGKSPETQQILAELLQVPDSQTPSLLEGAILTKAGACDRSLSSKQSRSCSSAPFSYLHAEESAVGAVFLLADFKNGDLQVFNGFHTFVALSHLSLRMS